MTIILALCAIVGIFKGFQEMYLVQVGAKPGCVQSKNLLTFMFTDKY